MYHFLRILLIAIACTQQILSANLLNTTSTITSASKLLNDTTPNSTLESYPTTIAGKEQNGNILRDSTLVSTGMAISRETDHVSIIKGGVENKTNVPMLAAVKKYVDNIYENPAFDWLVDSYIVTIMKPIVVCIFGAIVLFLSVTLVLYVKRRCRRRRLIFRKPLPKTLNSLKPSDRVLLLEESSDEEF